MEDVKVLIADDIAGTREDIKRLLYFEEDIKVVGEAADGEEALHLTETLKPDVVLMDINMPRLDGIQAAEAVSTQYPEVAVVIISIQGEQEYLRKAMAVGARDYLVKPFSSSELAETIRRASNFHKKRQLSLTGQPGGPVPQKFRSPGKIVAFFCTKGGVGRTTVACNLAVALAQGTGHRVALVDLDLSGGDAAVFLSINTQGTLAELVQEQDYTDLSLLESYLAPHFSGVKVLLSPADAEQAQMITAKQAAEILQILKKNYDYVVVDTAAGLHKVTVAALEAADQVLVPVTQDLPAMKHGRLNLDILERLGLNFKTKLILNRARPEILKPGELEKSLNFSLWHVIPAEEKIVLASINRGTPFVLAEAGSAVSQSIYKLAGLLAKAGEEMSRGEKAVFEEKPASGEHRSLVGRFFKAAARPVSVR